jgi:undecaprenyl-diphosphatase
MAKSNKSAYPQLFTQHGRKCVSLLEQLLNTMILGLIQGLAEWLPISSTAHLKIAEHFLDLTVTPLFNIVLHVGTLVVVVFFFRREVENILAALVHLDFRSENGMLIPLIIVATIPTALIGLVYVEFFEEYLQTIPIIAITFLIGATIVYTSKLGKENVENPSYITALTMGFAQGFAVFPGLSRSGATISAALLLGLKREKAFKFSFLLSIPAIIGDLAVETYKQHGQLSTSGIGTVEMLLGVAVTVAVGYIALRILSRMIVGKKFHYFAFYTWALGIALLILTVIFH